MSRTKLSLQKGGGLGFRVLGLSLGFRGRGGWGEFSVLGTGLRKCGRFLIKGKHPGSRAQVRDGLG